MSVTLYNIDAPDMDEDPSQLQLRFLSYYKENDKAWEFLILYSEYSLLKKYNTMTKRKRTKGQTTIYKTLHRKLKMEQHEPTSQHFQR
jgi:hypothetical protein